MFEKHISVKKYLEHVKINNPPDSNLEAIKIFDEIQAIIMRKPSLKFINDIFDYLSDDCGIILTDKDELYALEYTDSEEDQSLKQTSVSVKENDYYKLSNEELIRIYKINSDMNARECLILKNKNLVKKAAYVRRTYSSLEYDDLVQEGMIGLIYGIEKYDIKYETQFTTYVYYWIVQVMDRAIYDKGSTVRLPVHLIEKMNKLSRLEGLHATSEGRVSPEGICNLLNISMSEYNLLKFYIQNFKSIASLNKTVGDESGDSDNELIDFIPNSSTLSDTSPTEDETENRVISNQLRIDLDDVLKTLTPREEKILRLRFGLDDGHDMTLEEIGRKFNVTRERIRQIEARALRKLRHPSRSKKLRDYYDG